MFTDGVFLSSGVKKPFGNLCKAIFGDEESIDIGPQRISGGSIENLGSHSTTRRSVCGQCAG